MNEAYADPPEFTAFIVDDPNNLDNVYSNGDSITITFDHATNSTVGITMTQAEIVANFTFAAPAAIGTTYSGIWNTATQLVITVTDVGATVLTLGATTVDDGVALPANIAEIAGGAANLLFNNAGGPLALTGDFGILASGDSCNRDCVPPTMGSGVNGGLLVTNGFSYNVYATNVSQWHTAYPLIVVETGKTNILQAKIYDDWGIDNIKAIRVAFGVPEIGQFYNGETIVEYNPNGIIGPQVNVIDKNNLLDNVEIKTWTTSCNDSETSPDCLMFSMVHMFREAPLANIVGITVSDKTRNAAQFYFNHGIEVEGDSLNPPVTATIPQHTRSGGIIQLTQIDRGDDIWMDENENIWTKNSYNTCFNLTHY